MSDEKKLPKRRFKQFLNTPSWEQRKLGEITEIITKGTTPIDKSGQGEISFIKVENIDPFNCEINSCTKITKKEHEGYLRRSQLKSDDILFSIAGTLGRIGMVTEDILPANTNQALAIIRLSNGDVKYITKVLGSKVVEEYIRKNPTVGAQPNLSLEQVSNLIIPYPSDEEQIKLGVFFKAFDNLITLHQRKLNKLEKLKKAYLEELFPTGDQRKPTRRFKEFNDDWEQRKLTDISKTFIGLVTTMTTNYREEGTLLIRNSDIRDNKFIFSEKPIYLDSEFAKSNESRKLKSGDVVTVHTGDIGTSAVVEEDIEGAIGFATINTRPDINYLDSDFLSTYFNTESHKKYAISVATGDGRSNYNIKDFNKLMLYMPSVNEQKTIAEFIKRITNLITLHQRKLKKLKKLKEAYLDELFV